MNMDPKIEKNLKCYRVFMYVPRALGLVTLKNGADVECELGTYDFGKMPAASKMHALKTVWQHVPHKGPAMLDMDGKPCRVRKIKFTDLVAEECEPDPPRPAVVE